MAGLIFLLVCLCSCSHIHTCAWLLSDYRRTGSG